MHARRLALIVVLALAALAACGRSSTFTPGASDELVLRMDVTGGFTPPQYQERDVPEWSLFADGRLVIPGPQIEIYPGPALPALNQRTLTADAIARIVARAREAGLEGPDRTYPATNVADAPDTVFTHVIDGVAHTTRVGALSGFDIDPNASAEEQQARRDLQALVDDLNDLASWLDDGDIGEEEPFEAAALAVYVHPYQPAEDLKQEAKDWPLDEPLATFGEPTRFDSRCGVARGGDFDALMPLAREANELTPWRSEGERYQLVLRPLLPDQSGC